MSASLRPLVESEHPAHDVAERDPVGRSQDAVREELRRQISAAEVIIALASLYPEQQDMLIFELNFAKASDKPVVLLPLFGR